MEDIIKKWIEFELFWESFMPIEHFGNGKSGRMKPSFYDFMHWLKDNYKDNG